MGEPDATPAVPAVNKPRTVTGDLRLYDRPSKLLAESRTIAIWLPPNYQRDDARRFPVIYLQDGQNVFDSATAFGDEWQVDETATTLITRSEIDPIIVVGVYNAGDARIDEYTASVDVASGRGGGLELYGRMLVEELKPWMDSNYRTLPSAATTALGGSSLGALATLQLGLRYFTTFGRLAAHSPSVWWNDRAILKEVERLPDHLPLKIWLDAGTAEGSTVIPDVRSLRDALLRKGWRLGDDLAYVEVEGAGHDERAWRARVAPMLRYLFPGRGRPLERVLSRLRDRWR